LRLDEEIRAEIRRFWPDHTHRFLVPGHDFDPALAPKAQLGPCEQSTGRSTA
jgi:hypothetical protein